MSKIDLHNDDCMNIFKTIKDESIDLIVTDPPYLVSSRGSAGTAGGMLSAHSAAGFTAGALAGKEAALCLIWDWTYC